MCKCNRSSHSQSIEGIYYDKTHVQRGGAQWKVFSLTVKFALDISQNRKWKIMVLWCFSKPRITRQLWVLWRKSSCVGSQPRLSNQITSTSNLFFRNLGKMQFVPNVDDIWSFMSKKFMYQKIPEIKMFEIIPNSYLKIFKNSSYWMTILNDSRKKQTKVREICSTF